MEPTIASLASRVADVVLEGNYGKVSIYDQVVLKEGKKEGAIGPHEIEVQNLMASMGYSPAVLEVEMDDKGEPKAILMAKAEGRPVWNDYRATDEEKEAGITLSAAQVTHLSEALQYLHKSGYAHNDLHVKQVLVKPDSDKMTLIDFGLTKTLEEKPEGAWQDLTKSSSFANYSQVDSEWARFVVPRLEEFKSLKASKADKARKTAIMEEYLTYVRSKK